MPRTNAYDQNLDPSRPGEPVAGWDVLTAYDQQTNTTWEVTYGAPDVAPKSVQAQRDAMVTPPKQKRG